MMHYLSSARHTQHLCMCTSAGPEKPQRGCSNDFKQKSALLLQPVSSARERWNHDESKSVVLLIFSAHDDMAQHLFPFWVAASCWAMYLFLDWLTALIIHLQAITALQKNRLLSLWHLFSAESEDVAPYRRQAGSHHKKSLAPLVPSSYSGASFAAFATPLNAHSVLFWLLSEN